MPELPEVQTTVNGLRSHTIGLKIVDVWSDYNSPYFKGSDNIKDRKYFAWFKKQIIGRKIVSVSRRAKNILIHTSLTRDGAPDEKIILVHMKMTGHLLYGKYHFNKSKKKDPWEPISPESLKDPFNKRVHFVISFDNKKHLALSDTRKFAKVTLIDAKLIHESEHLHAIGPEPLEKSFNLSKFIERISLQPNKPIKLVLMDQSTIAGIGNIYADESLWRAGIHPLSKVSAVKKPALKKLFEAIKSTLSKGIDFGGDSMSDYRNILGEKGSFQEQHRAYQRTGEKCSKKGCGGKIIRIVVGGRGTHLCDKHQKNKKM
jgi:formamidopyrimidine-DNA glycosylase